MSILSSTFPDVQTLPFFGLGMSLGRILVKARAVIRLALTKKTERTLALTTAHQKVSGYKLLVLQGREIRGQ